MISSPILPRTTGLRRPSRLFQLESDISDACAIAPMFSAMLIRLFLKVAWKVWGSSQTSSAREAFWVSASDGRLKISGRPCGQIVPASPQWDSSLARVTRSCRLLTVSAKPLSGVATTLPWFRKRSRSQISAISLGSVSAIIWAMTCVRMSAASTSLMLLMRPPSNPTSVGLLVTSRAKKLSSVPRVRRCMESRVLRRRSRKNAASHDSGRFRRFSLRRSAASSSLEAALASFSRVRATNSAAAARVNVRATICSGLAPVARSLTIRSDRAKVLPEPAEARMTLSSTGNWLMGGCLPIGRR